ncbi:Myc-type, basic helix-loop-helix domain-containing protein, partial [Syncephalis fuscata]
RPKKPAHELLTDSEKKANHIASEQKRRQNIRVGFASLTTMVPTLSQCSRSEALILQKSVEYIRQLVQQRRDMAQRIHELRNKLGEPQIELPGDNED